MATEKHQKVLSAGQRVLKHTFWLCTAVWILLMAVWIFGGRPLVGDAETVEKAHAFRTGVRVWTGMTLLWLALWRWSLRRAATALLVSAWTSALLLMIWGLAGAWVFAVITGFVLYKTFRGYRAAVALRKAGTFATLSPEVFD